MAAVIQPGRGAVAPSSSARDEDRDRDTATEPHAWSRPTAAAGDHSSICLVCSLAVATACAVLLIFMACQEGTAPSPAVSGVTADPGNKEKLGQKGIFTEVNVTRWG